jgi:hypothetical protein
MGRACSEYVEEEGHIQSGGNLKERDNLGDTGLDGRIL